MSDLNSQGSSTAQISPESVLRQLDTILASETFKNSSRLSRFLRYVVEHSLEGQTGLKERQLGADVFDRSEDYNPRADPVVRVEARQLRFKLAEYYAAAGAYDEILITLPKGGYAACFEQRAAITAEASNNSGTETAEPFNGNAGEVTRPPAETGSFEPPFTEQRISTSKARWKWTLVLSAIALGVFVVAVDLLQIRNGLLSRITAGSSNRTTARSVNPRARDLYLKGIYYWNKRTPDALTRAVDNFTQAIVQDPAYAQAYVGLADCYNLLSEFSSMPPREAFPRASAAAKRAVELDDSSAEAHNALAFASFWGLWDVKTADREFQRALALRPDYALAHHWYATYLVTLGRVSESLAEIQRARELDPLSTPILADMGLILFYADRKQEAFTQLRQLEATDPRFLSSHHYLKDMALVTKDYSTYVSEARQMAGISHDAGAMAIAEAAQKGLANGGGQAMLQSVLLVEKRLYAQRLIPAYSLAQTCALMGEKQAAFGYLRRAFDDREIGILALRVDFLLRSLHSDPDYAELLRRAGLPPLH